MKDPLLSLTSSKVRILLPLIFMIFGSSQILAQSSTCVPGSVNNGNGDDWSPDCYLNNNCDIQGNPCQANDVNVLGAYVADINGDPIVPCQVGTQVQGYIWATFQNTTGTDRYAVRVYAEVDTNGVSNNVIINTCAFDNITANSTQEAFLAGPITWTCGSTLGLNNIWIAWSTSNGNQCSDSGASNYAFDCGDYPASKCFNNIDGIQVIAPNFSFECGTVTASTIEICFTDLSNGGELPYMYNWDFDDGGTSTAQNPCHTFMATSGVFDVVLTITDANGANASALQSVDLDALFPDVDLSVPMGFCAEDPEVTGIGGGTPEGGAYSGTGVTDDGNGMTYTFDPSTAGVGNHTISYTYSEFGTCESTATGQILVSENPSCSIAAADELTCTTTSVTLDATPMSNNASASYSYAWTGPNSFSSADQDPMVTQPGTYTLTVTDTDNGCTSSCDVTVTQDIEAVSCSIAAADELTCTTTSVTLDATPMSNNASASYSYAWTGPNSFSSADQDPMVTQPGTYTLTVTDTDNGCTSSCDVTVTQDIEAVSCSIAAADELTCTTTSVTLDATPMSNNASASYSYAWTGPNSFSSTDQDPMVTQPGTYMLTVTDTDNGCTNSCDVTVTQDIEAVSCSIAAADELTCTTTSVTLDATPVSANANASYSYAWTGPNSFSSTDQDPMVTQPGTYTLTVTDTDNGCTSSCDVTVTQDIEAVSCSIAAADELTCATTSITLDATAMSSNASASFSYAWTGPNSFSSADQDPMVTQPGTYTLTVTDTDNGCTSSCDVTVTQDIETVSCSIAAADELTCTTTSITLDATPMSANANASYSYAWTGPNSFSSTDQDPMVTQPGTYTLTVTDTDNGCTNSCDVTVTQDIEAVSCSIAAADELTCTTTSITLDATPMSANANASYSYAWTGPNSFSSADQDPMVTQPGTYTLTVTDTDNGCTNSCDVTVTQDIEAVTCSIAAADELTCTTTSVTLDATPMSANANASYSYAWTGPNSFSSTDQDPMVTQPGIYILTVTDTDNGCTNSCDVTVTQDIEAVTCSIAAADELTCTTTSITLDATPMSANASASYSYAWTGPNSFSSADQDPMVTQPGTYTLTVTDTDNGCTNSCDVTVTQDIEAVTCSIAAADELTCTTTSVTLDATPMSANANASYSYAWTGPNSFSSTDQDPMVTQPGIYILTVTDTDNGCTSSCDVTVTQDIEAVSCSIAAADELTCTTTSVTLDATPMSANANASYSYAWTGPNSFSSTDQDPMVTQPGIYILTVTDTDNGCTSSCDVTVTQDIEAVSCSIAAAGELTCTTTSITLDATPMSANASASYSYAWTGPNSFSSTDEDPMVTQPGTYTLTVTDTDNGCTSSCDVTVTQDIEAVTCSIAAADELTCTTTSVTLDATPMSANANASYSYAWTGPNSFSSTDQDPMVTQPGTYTLTVTDTDNGCTSSCDVTVTQDIEAVTCSIAAADELTCTTTSITLDATPMSANASASYSYAWTGPNSFSSTDQNPMVSAPGTYTLTVTDTDNGCTSSCDVTVTQDIEAVSCSIAAADELTCTTTSITLDATPMSANANASYSYAWTGPNSFSSTDQDPMVTQPGTYTLTVTDTDNGCTSSCDVTVTQDIEAVTCSIAAADELTCTTTSITLDATPMSANANASYSYAWTGPNSFSSTDQDPMVTQPGTYTLTVTDTDNGCTSSCDVTVTQDIEAVTCSIAAADELTCTTTSITLDATPMSANANASYSYAWTGPNSFSSTDQDPMVTQPGTYTLTVTDTDNGCTSSCDVTVTQDIEAVSCSIAAADELTCTTTSITLDATPMSANANASYSYAWTGPNSFSSTDQDPMVTQPGTYTLTVTDTDNGCTSSCDVTVTQDIEAVSCSIAAADELTCTTTSITLDATPMSANASASFSYAWTGPNSFSSTDQDPMVTQPGTYTLAVTDTDNGCTSSCDVTVSQDVVVPICTITGPSVDCSADQGLVYRAPVGNYLYSWSIIGNGSISGPTGVDSVVINAGVTGSFTVQLSITEVSNGCTSECNLPVAIPDPLQMQASVNCNNLQGRLAEVSLNLSGGTTPYEVRVDMGPWRSVMNDTIMLENGQNYLVEVRDANLCETSQEVEVLCCDITCPSDAEFNCGDQASIDDWLSSYTLIGCVGATVSTTYDYDDFTGSCGTTGSQTVMFTVTDANDIALASCTAVLSILDTIPPVIVCPVDTTVACPGDVSPASLGMAMGSDDCDVNVDISYADVVTLGNCPQEYSIVRTWTATDACNNMSSCDQLINVIDTVAPEIPLISNVDTVHCTDIFDIVIPPLANDACQGDVPVMFNSYNTDSLCTGTFKIILEYSAEDACGNASMLLDTIQVMDTLSPEIVCPMDVTLDCPADTSVANTGIATASDLCSEPVMLSHSDVVIEGNCQQEFVVNRTWSVVDDCGNSASCLQVITVQDTVAPQITCPVDLTLDCPAYTEPSATGTARGTDACDNSVRIDYSDRVIQGICVDEYMISRTWTASDACGNMSSCVQTISVQDTTPPTIVMCPADITVDCDAAMDTMSLGSAQYEDACSNDITVDFSDVREGFDGTCTNQVLGQITRTFSATDACGNVNELCTQVITVQDTTAPVIRILSGMSSGDTIFFQCRSQDPDWSLPPMGPEDVEATDNCDQEVEVIFTDEVVSEGDCATDGYFRQFRCTWTAIDDCGNSATSFIIFNIVDTINPTFVTFPNDTTVECNSIPELTLPEVTDECLCAHVDVREFYSPEAACESRRVLYREFTASDHCGNTTVDTQRITLLDTQSPEFSTEHPMLEGLEDGEVVEFDCNAGGFPDEAYEIGSDDMEAEDGCSETGAVVFKRTMEDGYCALDGYSERMILEWFVQDACGNKAERRIEFWLTDDVLPISYGLEMDTICVSRLEEVDVFAYDECSRYITPEYSDVTVSRDACGELIERTYFMSDACGNTLIDTLHILLGAESTITFNPINPLLQGMVSGDVMEGSCHSGEGRSITGFSGEDVVGFSGCQSNLDVQFEERMIEGVNCSGLVEARWFVEDRCGNTGEYMIQVKVEDRIAPSVAGLSDTTYFSCRDDIPELVITDNCELEESDLELVATTEGRCAQDVTYQYEASAVDACGNVMEQMLVIIVEDKEGPEFREPEVICAEEYSPIRRAYDTCSDKEVSVRLVDTRLISECGDRARTAYTYEAVDACGNITRFTQIHVEKTNDLPTSIFANDFVASLALNREITVSSRNKELLGQLRSIGEYDLFAIDDCGDVTIDYLYTDEVLDDCRDDKVKEVITHRWIIRDICGAELVEEIVIEITDDEAPFIEPLEDLDIYCDVVPAPQDPEISDNYEDYFVQYLESRREIEGGYVLRRTWTVTDDCGNTSVEVQTVTVIEDAGLKCEIDVPDNLICGSTNNIIGSTVTGGTEPYTYQWDADGDCFILDGGTNPSVTLLIGYSDIKLTLTVTDANGCTTECVTVIECQDKEESLNGGLSSPVETRSVEFVSDIMVFPNPATDYLIVRYNSMPSAELMVRDMTGRVLLQQEWKGVESRLDMTGFKEGSYLIQIFNDSEMVYKPFIIIQN